MTDLQIILIIIVAAFAIAGYLRLCDWVRD
jgi:hypothetical protein